MWSLFQEPFSKSGTPPHHPHEMLRLIGIGNGRTSSSCALHPVCIILGSLLYFNWFLDNSLIWMHCRVVAFRGSSYNTFTARVFAERKLPLSQACMRKYITSSELIYITEMFTHMVLLDHVCKSKFKLTGDCISRSALVSGSPHFGICWINYSNVSQCICGVEGNTFDKNRKTSFWSHHYLIIHRWFNVFLSCFSSTS